MSFLSVHGLDVTTTVWFDEADLATVTASGTELATAVEVATARASIVGRLSAVIAAEPGA